MAFNQVPITPRVPFIFCLAIVFVASLANAESIGASLQTLNALTPYSAQEPCATACFYRDEGACSDDLIGATLGCAQNCISWASNDCYCRTDYQSIATSYLYTCVSKACTQGDNGPDISTATSLYNAYCTGLGFTAVVEATTTSNTPTPTVTHSSPSSPISQTTSFSSSNSNPATTSVAQTSNLNAGGIASSSASSATRTSGTSSVSSSSGGSQSLSPGDIAGIASAIIGFVGIVIAILSWRYPHWKKGRENVVQ